MTNKELQEKLSKFPDDMEVMLDRNGCIFTKVDSPYIKLLNEAGRQRECIILDSPIPIN